VLPGQRASLPCVFHIECFRRQAQLGCQFAQHGHVGNATAFFIVRALLAVDHVEPASGHCLGGQRSGNRWLGVHDRRRVAQQAFKIRFAERLAGQLTEELAAKA